MNVTLNESKSEETPYYLSQAEIDVISLLHIPIEVIGRKGVYYEAIIKLYQNDFVMIKFESTERCNEIYRGINLMASVLSIQHHELIVMPIYPKTSAYIICPFNVIKSLSIIDNLFEIGSI